MSKPKPTLEMMAMLERINERLDRLEEMANSCERDDSDDGFEGWWQSQETAPTYESTRKVKGFWILKDLALAIWREARKA